MGRTLFLIESPFQCLCMMEAIQHFKITSYEVMIPYGDEYSNEMMFRFLNENSIMYEARPIAHIIYDVGPLVFSKKKFKSIFVGNYSATKSYPLAVAMAGFNSTINYLDDGTQAMTLFSEHPKPRYDKLSIKIIIYLYRILAFIKRVRESVFFTIYDVKSDKFIIEKNEFSLLRSDNGKVKSGVYIVGTNSSILKFADVSYLDYVKALVERARIQYPEEQIYYCPHRRDANNDANEPLFQKMGIQLFKTNISVEYDFYTKQITPIYVIGFLSNALFTLNMMYPDSIIETVSYQLDNQEQNKENQIIEKELNNNGIRSVYLF